MQSRTVSITADSIELGGEISCNGGHATKYGGGAGGRIALIVTGTGATLAGIDRSLLHCYAGYHGSWSRAGNGTIYFETAADSGRGELYLNSGGATYDAAYAAGIEGDSSDNDFNKISFANKGALTIMPGAVLKADELDGSADATAKGIFLAGGTLASDSDVLTNPGVFVHASPRRPTQYGHIGNAGSIRVKNGTGTFELTGQNGAYLRADCPFTVDCNLLITNAGKVTCCDLGTMRTVYTAAQRGTYALPNATNLLEFTVSGDVRMDAGTKITAVGCGYGASSGPGAPIIGGGYNGASYGGRADGRDKTTVVDPSTLPAAYGSIYNPCDHGSGGSSSSGGGTIRLTVNGKLDVDGTITANGVNAGAGPGTGGSLVITCGELASMDKQGVICADAGDVTAGGYYACGGGGRVAITLVKPGADFTPFGSVSNRITAYGSKVQYNPGSGWRWGRFGSPGTVYLRTAAQDERHGRLVVQHGTNTFTRNIATDIAPGVEGREFGDVELIDNALLRLGVNETISVNGGWSSDSTSIFSNETGSVVAFTGTADAVITGTNDFLNLTCTVPGKTFRFGTEGSRFGIPTGGVLTFAGGSGDDEKIKLRSIADGTRWPMYFAAGAVAVVDGVDVKDSDNTGASVLATHSIDSENNQGWLIMGEIVGADNYWTGAFGSDWQTGDNWSLGRLPVTDDHVFISVLDSKPYPVLNSFFELNRLTVAAGASLTVNGELTITNTVEIAGSLDGSGTLAITGVSADFEDAEIAMAGTLLVGGGANLTVDLSGDTVGSLVLARTGGTVSLPSGATATNFRFTGSGTAEFGAGKVLSAADVRIDGIVSGSATITLKGEEEAVWYLDATKVVLVNGVTANGSHARILPVFATGSSQSGTACVNWSFSGTQCTWSGEGGTTDWSTAGNWEGGVPNAGDVVLVPDEAVIVAAEKAAFHSLFMDAAVVTFAKGFDATGVVEMQSGAVLAADAPTTVAGLFTVHSGATLTHSTNTAALQTAGTTNSLDITVGDDMVIEAGATIDLMAKGYAARTGPGSPTQGQVGGSYGGISDNANDGQYIRDCYGSIRRPVHLGSGANTLGGGAVKLAVAGTLTLDGDVICRGGYTHQYSGSGGGVYFICGKLLGSGTVDVNAGYYYGGGWAGGGGRAAVWLTDADAKREDFSGTITAYGCLYATANGAVSYPPRSSCGTIFWHLASDNDTDGGYVLIDGCDAYKYDTGPYVSYHFRTEVPAKGEAADDALDFRNTSFLVTRKGTMYLSRNLTVYDIDFGSGARIRLNGHTLTVLSRAHRDRKGWVNQSPELVSTIASDEDAPGGTIRWLPTGTMILLR